MGWKAYRLVYQAKSPIHIGWHTLGYIKLTRYYIPGKNMWGAFTANMTRVGEDKKIGAYEDYGKEVFNKDIFISYFYPALFNKQDLQVILPQYIPKGLLYGKYNKEDFEKLFVKSYGQTAVLPESNTAEDESLHESEFIAPVIEDERTGEQMPVYFVGYVFMKDDTKTKDNKSIGWDDKEISLRDIVQEIFVGGDRKYGWGRLVMDEEKTKDNGVTNLFDNELILDEAELKVKIRSGNPIPAHLPINSDLKVKGDIEPLIGREWGEIKDNEGITHIGFGQRISDVNICWMPGSVLLNQEDLRFDAYGILKKD